MDDPVQIELRNIGKRFKHWIFRDINLTLTPSRSYGVVGHNGIGKSTLLRIISGYTAPSTGKVIYSVKGHVLDVHTAASKVSFAAPYIDVIEELTVLEMIRFHHSFKKFIVQTKSISDLLGLLELENHGDLMVGDLSSGLMQRLKVGLMIITQTPVLMLDEPTSYLDVKGKKWFHQLLGQFRDGRLVIIASNDPDDLTSVDESIDMLDFIHTKSGIKADLSKQSDLI
ncbi:MAG: ATP-binding cassette domain-containing protein [Saprospiraceae bacterium]|nr:ATP-binding cassette domain-containing protein [Saprospiraceae bacterium]